MSDIAMLENQLQDACQQMLMEKRQQQKHHQQQQRSSSSFEQEEYDNAQKHHIDGGYHEQNLNLDTDGNSESYYDDPYYDSQDVSYRIPSTFLGK